MDATKKTLEKLRSGEINVVDRTKKLLERIKKENKELNCFLYVAEKEALKQAKEIEEKIKSNKAGKLAGLTVGVKAAINVIGMPISCASKTLEDYYGTFDADVITKIKVEDGIIIGITNCDEFCSGISGEHSAFGPTLNPVAKDVVPGGSSSGSAAAVAAGLCDFALGTDTGGSIRNPSSHCGIVGIKPSYGRVSRYGVVDLSMSLDQVAPCARDVFGSALLLEVISGKSISDPTTFDEKVENYSSLQKPKKVTIGLIKEFEKLCTNKEIYELIVKSAQTVAKQLNTKIVDVSLKYIDLGVQTYYPIVYTEFFSATRRFDGRRYGKKIEESAGKETLRRIAGGKEISRAEHGGQYYRKALATKNLIKKDFDEAFKKVDVIVAPVTPELPHKLGSKLSPEEEYAMDAFTIPANLAGVSAGVVPIGKINDIPVGLQAIVPAFKEKLLCDFLNSVELINNS